MNVIHYYNNNLVQILGNTMFRSAIMVAGEFVKPIDITKELTISIQV